MMAANVASRMLMTTFWDVKRIFSCTGQLRECGVRGLVRSAARRALGSPNVSSRS
jgi:hypothetical protein